QHLGSFVPHIYNFFAANTFTSSILKQVVGFAPERHIPLIHRTSIVHRTSLHRTSKKVYLFLDEFTRYNEPALAQTFIDLLTQLGYNVLIPKHVESGRAAISKGCLRLAKRYANKNVRLLKELISADTPLVGIEPSCILTFRDEYPNLVVPELQQAAEDLGKNCLLFDEFLMREVNAGRITKDAFSEQPMEIWLHGHCHQKALVGVEKTAELLRLPKNATVHVIPSGCCGMAGSFGYEKAHYKTSIAIGEMVLFPAVREAMKYSESITLIAAPGTSCRTQIKDGTGYTAHHPIEILYRLLK
ncbi:MAG: FAD-binding oxidoreductase, partial [Paludibacteraceae bacterium]|nr:FAD-binding oxidoreductase [Paludibacteraceae bacterium]